MFKFSCFAWLVRVLSGAALCLAVLPGAGFAEETLYPAPAASLNGAYLLCESGDFAQCYALRERYYNTNTQLEHVADRLLLRTGGSGFIQTLDSVLPLSWSMPRADLLRIEFRGGTVWEFVPQGAFLLNEVADKYFIFARSEREYEDSEGGIITLP